ncbi:MAG: hypothetical protein IJ307_10560 [Bacteroidales bacterium]|nr:hypothetical protein [Bacteroidales bacterium]
MYFNTIMVKFQLFCPTCKKEYMVDEI